MSRQWELQRIGILRLLDCFQVVSPAGSLYEMDKCSLKLLLEMHGKSADSDIKNYTREEINELALFAEEEVLLRKKSTIILQTLIINFRLNRRIFWFLKGLWIIFRML